MSFDLQITIPENSPRWRADQKVAEAEHITPEEAAEKVFDDGVKAQNPSGTMGNISGLASDDAEALDEIVSDAMAERRKRFERQLNA